MNKAAHTPLVVAYALIACVVVLGVYGVVAAGATFEAFAAATVAGAVCAGAFALGFNRLVARRSDLDVCRDAFKMRAVAPSIVFLLVSVGVAAVLSAGVAVCAFELGVASTPNGRLTIPVASPVALAAVIVGYYAATGVLEEALFRGVFMRACIVAAHTRGYAHPALVGVVLSAAVFALLHAGGTAPTGALAAAQLGLKVVSAFEFGVIMSALYLETSSLAVVICAHTVFDVVANGPGDFVFAGVTATYATGTWYDLAAIGATVIVLAPACVRMLKAL